MCLRDQIIDENNGVIDRERQACGLSDDDGGVSRGQGIDCASEGLETTNATSRIQGRRWRLRRCDVRPEELATTVEALVVGDESKVLTTTTEASDEKEKETMCLSERL